MLFFETLVNKLVMSPRRSQLALEIFLKFLRKNPDCLQMIVDYLFLETNAKRKITLMVSLRLLEKLIRLDQSQTLKARVYEYLRVPLGRLIRQLRDIDLDMRNINSISMWIEDIFTVHHDLKRVVRANLAQVYDFGLHVHKKTCHDLFLLESYDTPAKRIYNSIFLFSRIAYFFERNMKPQKKAYNFRRMHYNFYSQSVFSKFRANSSYNISSGSPVHAQIKVGLGDQVVNVAVEVFLDDFYLVIIQRQDAVRWAKVLFLAKHKYLRAKLMDDTCIQVNTIIDKKTSFILFEKASLAKEVYVSMKSKKKSVIMHELTVFSENVEALQALLDQHESTETFDILTRNFNYNQCVTKSKGKSGQSQDSGQAGDPRSVEKSKNQAGRGRFDDDTTNPGGFDHFKKTGKNHENQKMSSKKANELSDKNK